MSAAAEGEEAGPPPRGRRRRGHLQEVPDHAAHGLHSSNFFMFSPKTIIKFHNYSKKYYEIVSSVHS